MLHRRPTATLVAVLLPLGAALTSCGFDYPTDRVNTIAAGVNNREAAVDVLGARVLASADGQGRLIGTLVYNDNDADAPATLTGIEGEDDTVQVDGKLPRIEVAPNKGVNLASDSVEPIFLSGDFTAGDFVSLTYAFSTTEVVTLEVPVVKPCGQYADIEVPEVRDDAAAEEGEESHAAEETDAEAHDEESDATYLCDHATEAPEEEGGH